MTTPALIQLAFWMRLFSEGSSCQSVCGLFWLVEKCVIHFVMNWRLLHFTPLYIYDELYFTEYITAGRDFQVWCRHIKFRHDAAKIVCRVLRSSIAAKKGNLQWLQRWWLWRMGPYVFFAVQQHYVVTPCISSSCSCPCTRSLKCAT